MNETLAVPSDRRSIAIASPRASETIAIDALACSSWLRRNSGQAARPASLASRGVHTLPDTRQMPWRTASAIVRPSAGTVPVKASAAVRRMTSRASRPTYSIDACPAQRRHVGRDADTSRVGAGPNGSPPWPLAGRDGLELGEPALEAERGHRELRVGLRAHEILAPVRAPVAAIEHGQQPLRPAAPAQRHHEHGVRDVARLVGDLAGEARVGAHVADRGALAALKDGAGDPHARPEPQADDLTRARAPRRLVDEAAALGVGER